MGMEYALWRETLYKKTSADRRGGISGRKRSRDLWAGWVRGIEEMQGVRKGLINDHGKTLVSVKTQSRREDLASQQGAPTGKTGGLA